MIDMRVSSTRRKSSFSLTLKQGQRTDGKEIIQTISRDVSLSTLMGGAVVHFQLVLECFAGNKTILVSLLLFPPQSTKSIESSLHPVKRLRADL